MSARQEPIAIVGTAHRFPGGCDTPSKLWELLKAPRDLLTEVPKERFNVDAFYHSDPTHHGTTNARQSYFLDQDLSKFDAQFFSIPPKEAESIDPQQRLLMETVYDSLCSAGIPMEKLRGSSTAAYVGMMCDDWSSMIQKDIDALPTYTGTGSARSIMSNRLSYFFDWQGPSMTIDTACSSSLVAVHEAVRVLRSGESTVAIAAGANLILNPTQYVAESNLRMLSPTGRSRMWDSSADGYARGEGIASVVLKTLSQAIADGDSIECIIRETGVNQDGRTSGLTVPSNLAQTKLIRDTYNRAGLDLSKPSDRPQLFHAHGTGTKAGDPQEAEAIHNAFFSEPVEGADKLYVGSIKTIIGHTEGTAGLASLIGTSLAIKNSTIPPNMHFNNLNPDITPYYNHLKVPTTAQAWPELATGATKRASINSFGFGGTNAHAIIEAYVPQASNVPNIAISPSESTLFTPLVFSAASSASLKSLVSNYLQFLTSRPNVSLRDLSWSLHQRQSTLGFRKAIAGRNYDEVCDALSEHLNGEEGSFDARSSNISDPRILGVFTGQGAQWPRMGAALLEASTFVAQRIADLDASLASLPAADRPSWTIRDQLLADASSSRISEAAISQPLCTAVQVVLVDLLESAGIKFAAVVGHSSGEIGAAYAAGLITARDAIRVAYYRGVHAKLAASVGATKKPGAMAAVGMSHEEAEDLCASDLLKGRVSVAAYNSLSSLTLSGDEDAVDEAIEILKTQSKFARRLKVDTAYHSAHMQACAEPYLLSLRNCGIESLKPASDRPKWFSSVSEDEVMTPESLNEQYWVDNMTNPVMFSSAVLAAADDVESLSLGVEVGPHAALKGPAMDNMAQADIKIPYTGVLHRGKDDVTQFASALGFLWSNTTPNTIDFEGFDKAIGADDSVRAFLKDLPSYPFNHQTSYWAEPRMSKALKQQTSKPSPVLGSQAITSSSDEVQWRNMLSPKEVPWIQGHKLQGQIIFPATGYIAMVIEALQHLTGTSGLHSITIQDLLLERAIVFNDENSVAETFFSMKVQTTAESISASFACFSCPEGETSLTRNASGRVQVERGTPAADSLPTASPQGQFNMVDVSVDRFYSELAKIGYHYSEPFKGMDDIRRKMGVACGTLADQSGSAWEDQLIVHPGMLDTALQTLFAALSYPGDESLRALHVPVGIDCITINPYFSPAYGGGKQVTVPWESVVRDEEKSHLKADVQLLSQDGEHTFVQIEGVSLKPLTAPRPADDVTLFSHFEYLRDRPEGESAAYGDKLSTEELKIAKDMERIAFFYLRKVSEMSREDRANALPHHQHLMAWGDYTVDKVRKGEHMSVDTECLHDTQESILKLTDEHRDRVDALLIESTGQNLPATIRAKDSILQHMTKDNLLSRFYEEGIGLSTANWWLAKMVKQISHRYPHMKILEIGAGTGGTTQATLPSLGTSFSSYTYTDVSSGFFEAAENKFSEYADRMIFKVFDMVKTPEEQGFTEGSYDMILASNVLHVAEDLDVMMTNVRKLLKPGGYLVNLETVTNDMLRNGIIMGGLPGWWIGAESGRPHGPMLDLKSWDSLLGRCGFGGIETSTPIYDSLHAVAVWAAQATDERVQTLKSPAAKLSPSEPIDAHLVTIGGKSLSTFAMVEKVRSVLQTKFASFKHVSSIDEVSMDMLPSGATVLSLADLDEPVMKEVTDEKMSGLKALWKQSRNILWVTKGARFEDPFSNMMFGIGRVVRFENPNINLKLLDIDSLSAKVPEYIANSLLEHQLLDDWRKEGNVDDLTWSAEPEVFLEGDTTVIPRLYLNEAQNARVNSNTRKIYKDVDAKSTALRLAASHSSVDLEEVTALEAMAASQSSGAASDTRTIRVQQSLLQCVRIGSIGSMMLCVGTDVSNPDTTILALTDSASSPATVPMECCVEIPGSPQISKVALSSVSASLVCSELISLVPKGSTILVHEASKLLQTAIGARARKAGVSAVFTTCNRDRSSKDVTFIHNALPTRLLRKSIPSSTTLFADFSVARGSGTSVGRTMATLLPSHCAAFDSASFFGTTPCLRPGSSATQAKDLLKEAWEGAMTGGTSSQMAPTIALADISSVSPLQEPLTLVDWTAPMVPVRVRPVDNNNIFRSDVTYLLIGLSGEVGQSLCQWMVDHGACHIVLTSRKPIVDPEFIYSLECQGANIRAMPLDITSKDSLTQCLKIIGRSMPKIGGVANGALIVDDGPFTEMSVESMQRVLKPKVDGSILLDEVFHDENLDFFIMFSSLTACLGNSGQSNYAAANMFMTTLAFQRRLRGVPGSVIDLSSLMGIGHVGRSDVFNADYFRSLGATSVSETDLHKMFAEAIDVGRPDAAGSAEVVTGMTPMLRSELEDCKVHYRMDLKFSHFCIEQSANHGQESSAMQVPVRQQLKDVKGRGEATRILLESFISRVKKVLQIPADEVVDENVALVERGVDSLVALDIRSWFLRELDVDMPVLKVLGGNSIAELIKDSMERMPTSVLDVSTLADDAATTQAPRARTKPRDEKAEAASMSSSKVLNGLSLPEAIVDGSSTAPSTNGWGTPINGQDGSARSVTSATSSEDEPVKETSWRESVIQSSSEVTEHMSFGQTRFWYLHHAIEDKTTFNVAISIRLDGRLDVDGFEKALQAVATKHEAMRTRYFWSGEDGDVATQGVLSSPLIKLDHRTIADKSEASKALSEMRDHEWDLSDWDSMRFMVLTVSEDVHWFIFGCHHISIDGVGIQIIFADLEKAYQGQILKSLPEASQYRAYSNYQREQLQIGGFQKDIAFYRDIIPPDVQPISLLPFSKLTARQPQTSYSTYRADIRLDKDITSRIKQVARQNQSTNFHLYLAVLQNLLFRLLPATDEIFVGIADANRNNARFTDTLGFFLNLLPIRFDKPNASARFSSAVKSARNKAYAALEHSNIPFDVLLNELGVTRSANTPPVFQVFVDYRQGTQERAKFAGFDVAGEEWHHPRTGYDISLDVLENAEGDSLVTLQLQQSLYTQQHTDLLLRAYVNLLKGFTRSPGRDFRVDAPSVWDGEDIAKALKLGRGPESPLQWPATISHRIDNMIEAHGSNLAIKDGRGKALTYSDIDRRIGAIAASLLAQNVSRGDVVGVLQEPAADWICSMLAIFRVGATYLPLDLRNSTHRLHKAVKAAQPGMFLVDNTALEIAEEVAQSKAGTTVVNVSNITHDAPVHRGSSSAERDSAAVILFTSGSTGEPKGIVLRHSNLVAQNEGFSKQCDVESGKVSKVLQQSALSFDFSMEQIFIALCNGGCLYVVPAENRGDPEEITKIILEEGINYTSGTPSEYSMWFTHAPERLRQCAQWNYAFFGGEPFSEDFIRNFRTLELSSLRVFNNYGPCETTIACTHMGEIKYNDSSLQYPLTAGYAAPNYEIYIVDEQLNPLPLGVPGEILIGGAGVSAGYLGLDDATRQKFLPSPFAKDSPNLVKHEWTTLYRTGDRGHLRSDGALRIEGRIDNDTQIKIRGFRVELSEIEKVILETAGGNLKHAVVTLRESNGADFLAAHVVFSRDAQETKRIEFLEALQAKLPLPDYMRPAVIMPLEEIPLTSHSKFDRAAVKALSVDASAGATKTTDETRELTSGEEKLAQLWRDVLPVTPTRAIQPDVSFFHVGGSSLLLVKLQRSIKQEFSAAPKLVELMNASKLGEMLAVITAAASRSLDWEAETAVPECWEKKYSTPDTMNRIGQSKNGLNVLLTGATGYLGRHLVPALIQSDQIAKLFCIVRRETDVEQLRQASDKVVIFTGDLGESRLGLKDDEWEHLASNADLILHSGANRSFWDDYEVLRPVNLDSVKELAEIALKRRVPFHFLSSGSVRIYGNSEGPGIYNIDKGYQCGAQPPVDGTDGYVASKWAAERFLRKVSNKFNLPVTLHTPMPVPDYGPDDSRAQPESDHMVNELVDITKRLQVRPTMEGLDGWADIVPTETVVGDILEAVFEDGKNGDITRERILHTGVRRINWQRFISELQNNPELADFPTKDTLLWIGQAKRSGYSYFMPAHRLVVLSSEGDMVSRR